MSRETVIWQSYTWRIDSMKLVYKIIITMDGDLDEAHTGDEKMGPKEHGRCFRSVALKLHSFLKI
jgi:hypothetical protein